MRRFDASFHRVTAKAINPTGTMAKSQTATTAVNCRTEVKTTNALFSGFRAFDRDERLGTRRVSYWAGRSSNALATSIEINAAQPRQSLIVEVDLRILECNVM
jgi:hypothetical protein